MSLKLLQKATASPSGNISITSTTLTNLDSTNLVVDFSTQDATEVEVKVACSAQIVNAGTFYFGLKDAAGIVAGTLRAVISVVTGTDMSTISYTQWITGLTPGQNYRWFLAAKVSGAGEQLDIVGTTSHGDSAQIVFTVTANEAG